MAFNCWLSLAFTLYYFSFLMLHSKNRHINTIFTANNKMRTVNRTDVSFFGIKIKDIYQISLLWKGIYIVCIRTSENNLLDFLFKLQIHFVKIIISCLINRINYWFKLLKLQNYIIYGQYTTKSILCNTTAQ